MSLHTMPPLLVQDISLRFAIMFLRICLATSTCEINPSKIKNEGIVKMKNHSPKKNKKEKKKERKERESHSDTLENLCYVS